MPTSPPMTTPELDTASDGDLTTLSDCETISTSGLPDTEGYSTRAAVVGLVGFSASNYVLQMHSLGFCGVAPAIVSTILCGGIVQVVCSLVVEELFVAAVFAINGIFSLGTGVLLVLQEAGTLSVHTRDIGVFNVPFLFCTAILCLLAMQRSRATALTFTALFLGTVGLVVKSFTGMGDIATASTMVVSSLGAMYIAAHMLVLDITCQDLFPTGAPILILAQE